MTCCPDHTLTELARRAGHDARLNVGDPRTKAHRDMRDHDYGSVEHNGKTLTLTQDAYCDNYGTDGGVRYYAHAKDATGSTYRIAWDTSEVWDALDPEDRQDESLACDWTAPVEIRLIEEA